MATPKKRPHELKRRGRPPADPDAPRKVKVTTDVTEAERIALVDKFGSAYAGLRAGIRLALADVK